MNRKLAIGLLVFANVMWGSSYAVVKVALAELPPPLLGALRITLATGLVWLILLWQARAGYAPGFEKVARRDTVKLAGLGFCGLALDYLLAYWGLSLTTATDASLMIIGEVIFTTLLAVWLLGEHLGRRKLLGIAAGVVGVVTLVFGNAGAGAASGGMTRALGDLLILAGLLAASFYSVLGAGLARRYHPLTVLGYAHAGSLLLWLPLLAWYILAGTFPAISTQALIGIAYLAIVTSVVCHLVWFHVVRVAGTNLGAISLFVQPLVGSLLGLVVLREPLTVVLTVGAALIFAALYFTTVPSRRAVIKAGLPEGSMTE